MVLISSSSAGASSSFSRCSSSTVSSSKQRSNHWNVVANGFWFWYSIIWTLIICCLNNKHDQKPMILCCFAKIYQVGPNQPYKTIGSAVKNGLKAGDQVLIYKQSKPYYEKFVINNQGTVTAPIIIRGIPDSFGKLPIIDGTNAKTPLELDYWSESRNLIKIGGSSYPSEGAAYITIENLILRNAKQGLQFMDDTGTIGSYVANAACIHIEEGQHIVIKNNTITKCGNGIFITPGVQNVTVESNYIYGNGNLNSIYEHNVYCEAIGIHYRYNRFGPLCTNCPGNNIKERSSGVVIAYNWIEGGNRQIDLVDTTESSIASSYNYRTTYVYGNIIIETKKDEQYNRQIIHYGGDSIDTTLYRKGTLFVYHNTIVSTRVGFTTFLRLSTSSESCQAYNNIILVTANGNQLELLAEQRGKLILYNNWIQKGYRIAIEPIGSGTVTFNGTIVGTTNNPGFSDTNFATSFNFRLGQPLLPSYPIHNDTSKKLWPKVVYEYVRHRSFRTRNTSSTSPKTTLHDIGAYSYQKL